MKVKFTKTFTKQYDKAPKKTRTQFDSRLKVFTRNKFNPLLKNHSLAGKYKGHRSINVTGNWRAIFNERGSLVFFVALGTHSQLYK